MSKRRNLIAVLFGLVGGLIVGTSGVAHGEGDGPLHEMVGLLSGVLSVEVSNTEPIQMEFDPMGAPLPVIHAPPPVEPVRLDHRGRGLFYTVPPGKLLVIETISVDVTGDDEPTLVLSVNNEYRFSLPAALNRFTYVGLHKTAIYALAGETLAIDALGPDTDEIHVAISGVLRDSIP